MPLLSGCVLQPEIYCTDNKNYNSSNYKSEPSLISPINIVYCDNVVLATDPNLLFRKQGTNQ